MSSYVLSNKATEDIEKIALFTIETWGLKQAKTYRDELKTCLEMLSINVNAGLDASGFAPNLKRFPFKAHTIFYYPSNSGILVVRILNQRMDFKKHL